MSLLTVHYKSAALQRTVKLQILLPADVLELSHTEQPYKTLYFLNGYSASGMEMLTTLTFQRQMILKPMAIVFPDGENSFYVDHPERNANFATFVNKEIVDFTRSILPLSMRREDTYIGGISMGAYGALHNGLIAHDTFSKILAMSPAVDIYRVYEELPAAGFTLPQLDNIFGSCENFRNSELSPEYAAMHMAKAQLPDIFLCCGQQDPLVYHQCRDFAQHMQEADRPIRFVEGHGSHDIDFWEGMMDSGFSFLADIEPGTRNSCSLA